MQGFDEHFLADTGFTVDQQRNVLFQQALGLTHGLFHAGIAEVQGLETDGRGAGFAGLFRFHEHASLHWRLFRPFQQALETVAPGGLQREGQAFGLVEQLQQRDLEQAVDQHPRQADAQQVVRPAVG